jgi:hypothetical protein
MMPIKEVGPVGFEPTASPSKKENIEKLIEHD